MSQALHLFAAYGIEMEYMIVHEDTLAIMPIADKILTELNGGVLSEEVDLGAIAVSNELVLHVIEFKCQGPQRDLVQMHQNFVAAQKKVLALLKSHQATLLPTAMHPLMDPDREMRLWPHGNSEIYAAYNRVFDCRGHGWSNLQSIHINLPFHGDQEFGVLHAAIRLVLPLLPALAASSPLVQGQRAENLDQRLEFYRKNQQRIPEITGQVIPEAVYSRKDYENKILKPCYLAISPHDPEGLLQEEWLNSRGAIARFDRDAIEIRVLDIQEAPQADFAIITLVVSLLKSLVAEHFCSLKDMKEVPEGELREIFLTCVKDGSQSTIANVRYLGLFGYKGTQASAAELWRFLLAQIPESMADFKPFLPSIEFLLSRGTLAERILRSLPKNHTNRDILETYMRISQSLKQDQLFAP